MDICFWNSSLLNKYKKGSKLFIYKKNLNFVVSHISSQSNMFMLRHHYSEKQSLLGFSAKMKQVLQSPEELWKILQDAQWNY